MGRLLIQPTVRTLDDYSVFASEHGLGFEVVDFALPDVLDNDAAEVLERYRSYAGQDRLVSAHGPFLDLYLNSPDAAIRRVAAERIGQALTVADELGLRFVVFHTNWLPMLRMPAYSERWVDSHVRFWAEVVDEHETTVVLENMWDASPEPLARVLEGVSSDRLGACLDTGHHLLFSREPLERWFRVLGDNIVYLHLTDNMGDVDSELSLGTGIVDWPELSPLVDRWCDQPYAVIETAGLQRVQASLSFLQTEGIYPFSGR